MFVRDFMSSPVITVAPEVSVQEAFALMRDRSFRRLPVVNRTGWLVGIVTERDFLYISPSPAVSLEQWEKDDFLASLKVEEIMAKHVVTATPDETLVDAANKMLEKKIGGLPVIDQHNQVIGVITASDILIALVQFLRDAPEVLSQSPVQNGGNGVQKE